MGWAVRNNQIICDGVRLFPVGICHTSFYAHEVEKRYSDLGTITAAGVDFVKVPLCLGDFDVFEMFDRQGDYLIVQNNDPNKERFMAVAIKHPSFAWRWCFGDVDQLVADRPKYTRDFIYKECRRI